jgi:prepilin-type processing-associated H-X9-DG protein/prepilin-type N-terminal cleavage/methylation domain-containing protein
MKAQYAKQAMKVKIESIQEDGISEANPAFTLLELLVVIAVIAILAALLLPALSRAKMACYRAGCAHNLHQIGVALRLYVDDFQRYPVFCNAPTLQDKRTPRSAFWDAQILPYAQDNQAIFLCPGQQSTNRDVAVNWSVYDAKELPWPNGSYGYNARGEGQIEVPPPPGALLDGFRGLGLDGTVEWGDGFTRTPICLSEGSVLVPTDMIAVVDYDPTVDDDNDRDYHPIKVYSLTLTGSRHNGRANAAFCDGHVEFPLTNYLKDYSVSPRWNYDHRSHSSELAPDGD